MSQVLTNIYTALHEDNHALAIQLTQALQPGATAALPPDQFLGALRATPTDQLHAFNAHLSTMTGGAADRRTRALIGPVAQNCKPLIDEMLRSSKPQEPAAHFENTTGLLASAGHLASPDPATSGAQSLAAGAVESARPAIADVTELRVCYREQLSADGRLDLSDSGLNRMPQSTAKRLNDPTLDLKQTRSTATEAQWTRRIIRAALRKLGIPPLLDEARHIVITIQGHEYNLGKLYDLLNPIEGQPKSRHDVVLRSSEPQNGLKVRSPMSSREISELNGASSFDHQLLDRYFELYFGKDYRPTFFELCAAFAQMSKDQYFYFQSDSELPFYSLTVGKIKNNETEKLIWEYARYRKDKSRMAENDEIPSKPHDTLAADESEADGKPSPAFASREEAYNFALKRSYSKELPVAVIDALFENPVSYIGEGIVRLPVARRVELTKIMMDEIAAGHTPEGLNDASSKYMEIFHRLAATFELSAEGDAALIEIFNTYSATTKLELLPFLHALVSRSESPEVIAAQARCKLYPYWGYRWTQPSQAVPTPPEGEEIVIDIAEDSAIYKNFSARIGSQPGMTPMPSFDNKTEAQILLSYIFLLCNGPIGIEAATKIRVRLKDENGAVIRENNLMELYLTRMSAGSTRAKIFEIVNNIFVNAFNFIYGEPQSVYQKLDRYFKLRLGRYYKLREDRLASITAMQNDDAKQIMIGSRAGTTYTLSDGLAQYKSSPDAFYTRVLKDRGELADLHHIQDWDKLLVIQREVMLRTLGKPIDEMQKWSRAKWKSKHMVELDDGMTVITSLDAINARLGEPRFQESSHANTNLIKSFIDCLPAEFYQSKENAKKISRLLLKQALAAGILTEDEVRHPDKIEVLKRTEVYVANVELDGVTLPAAFCFQILFRALTGALAIDAETLAYLEIPEISETSDDGEESQDQAEGETDPAKGASSHRYDFKHTLTVLKTLIARRVPEREMHQAKWAEIINDKTDIAIDEPELKLTTSTKAVVQKFREHLALHKLGLKEFPGGRRVTQSKELISDAELIDHIKFYVYNYENISTASDEKVIDLLEREKLEEVLLAIGDSAHDLAEYLENFRKDLVEKYGLDNLIRRFEGLEVAHGEAAEKLRHKSPKREEAYTRAILDQLAGVETLDERTLRSFEWTYRRILRRWLQEDAGACLDWLSRRNEEITDKRLREIFAKLFFEFMEDREFRLPETIRTTPYPFQMEAIRHFSSVEHKRGILADEPGLGKSLQAIGVAEATEARKVLWVCPNGIKQTIRKEILTHTNRDKDDVFVIASGGNIQKQLREASKHKYIIINYDILRDLETRDPEGYALLMQDIDLAIIDESQFADNTASQQGAAVQKIKADRILLLTATPYQQKPERLWASLCLVSPSEFYYAPDEPAGEKNSRFRAFKEKYFNRGREGLVDMHHLLQKYMLYRTKAEIFGEADPNKPIEEQKPGVLPKKLEVQPSEAGGYYMSEAQARLYIEIIADWEGFVERFYRPRLPASTPKEIENANKEIDRKKKDAKSKFYDLFRLTVDPEYFGINGPNPRIEEVKSMLRQHLRKGEKVVLWKQHKAATVELKKVIAELATEAEFKGLSFGLFDGSEEATKKVVTTDAETGEPITLQQRDLDRLAFQSDSNSEPRILICSNDAGAVGITLTAGTTSINYELPMMFTKKLQLDDRIHRIDKKFRKNKVFFARLMAKIPPKILDEVTDPELRALLEKGTVDEILFERIKGMTKKFRLIKEGYFSEEELQSKLEKDMFESVSFNLKTKSGSVITKIFETGRASRIEQKGQAFAKAYAELGRAGEADKQSVLAQIITRIVNGELEVETAATLMHELGEDNSSIKALKVMLGRNTKYFSRKYLAHIMPLVANAQAKGEKLSDQISNTFGDVLDDLAIPDRMKALILPLVALEGDASSGVARRIFDRIRAIREPAIRFQMATKLYTAFYHLLEYKKQFPRLDVLAPFTTEDWFRDSASAQDFAETLYTYSETIHSLTTTQVEALSRMTDSSAMQTAITALAWKAVGRFAEIDSGSNTFRSAIGNRPERVLAVANGLTIEGKKTKANLDRYRTYLNALGRLQSPVLTRGYLLATQGQVQSEAANKLDKANFKKMMETFSKPHETAYATVVANATTRRRITQRKAHLKSELKKSLPALLAKTEGQVFGNVLEIYLASQNEADRVKWQRAMAELKSHRQGRSYSEHALDLLRKVGITTAEFAMNQATYQEGLDVVQNWIAIVQSLGTSAADTRTQQRVDALLGRYDLIPEAEDFMGLLEEVSQMLAYSIEESLPSYNGIRVGDTDDAGLILNFGEFHPSVSVCVATDGAPWYLETMPQRLGTETYRLIPVTNQAGDILAVAELKIRVNQDGRPVYYIAGILSTGLYDFRNEIVAHVIEKARTAQGYVPLVAVNEKLGYGLAGTKEKLFGLGGFGSREFEEALMHVGPRDSKTLNHAAKVIYDPLERGDLKPDPQGESAEEKLKSIKVMVD